MRVVRMNRRSRYWGLFCPNCGHRVNEGDAALVNSLLAEQTSNGGLLVTTYKAIRSKNTVRIAYHRRCVESILEKSTVLDPPKAASLFHAYRERLLAERSNEDL